MTSGKPLPLSASSVIYAKDVRRVAGFYRRTLTLPVIEEQADFIVIGDGAVEIVVVRIPDSLGASIHIDAPPRLREETPIKCSYQVDDLDRVSAEAAAAGGGTKPIDAAWRWRGQLHLDGYDPEGNVVQFRRRDDA